MKSCSVHVIFVSISIMFTSASGKNEPTKSTTPLSTDEISVYRAVLEERASGGRGSVSVSATTFPLDLSSHQGPPAECLRGIELEGLPRAGQYFHLLPAEVLSAKSFRFVDRERLAKVVGRSTSGAEIVSMSEVAFDKEHRYAFMIYRYRGSGHKLVFERVDNKWKETKRNCGGWIS